MNARMIPVTLATVIASLVGGANAASASGIGHGRNDPSSSGEQLVLTGVVNLHNATAESGSDCPADGNWWHFVVAPNSGRYEIASMTLNIDGSLQPIDSAAIVTNHGQTDNVFVAVPAGRSLTDLSTVGSSAEVSPFDDRVRLMLSHTCGTTMSTDANVDDTVGDNVGDEPGVDEFDNDTSVDDTETGDDADEPNHEHVDETNDDKVGDGDATVTERDDTSEETNDDVTHDSVVNDDITSDRNDEAPAVTLPDGSADSDHPVDMVEPVAIEPADVIEDESRRATDPIERASVESNDQQTDDSNTTIVIATRPDAIGDGAVGPHTTPATTSVKSSGSLPMTGGNLSLVTIALTTIAFGLALRRRSRTNHR